MSAEYIIRNNGKKRYGTFGRDKEFIGVDDMIATTIVDIYTEMQNKPIADNDITVRIMALNAMSNGLQALNDYNRTFAEGSNNAS